MSLSLRLRKIAPRPLRFAYRLWRSATFDQPLSQTIPAELFEDARFHASREDLVGKLPHNAIVAEVGTDTGYFAREIINRTSPKELHLVDLEDSRFDKSLLDVPCVRFHKGWSTQVLDTFHDGTFDWIYLDAAHDFDSVWADTNAAAPKVKPGGFIVFNDFAHIDPYLGRYGVHKAATDFVVANHWQVHALAFNQAALYDLAIRKPT